MARKTKRRQPARTRRPAPGGGSQSPRPAAAPRSAQAARVGGDQALVRSVEMSLAPGAPPRGRGGRVVLDNTDPAIPLDRVPYFLSDLARLGIVAAVMVVLMILAAEFLIPLAIR